MLTSRLVACSPVLPDSQDTGSLASSGARTACRDMAQFSIEVKVGLNLLRSVESVEYLVAGVELPVPVAHAPAVLVQPLDVLDVGLAVQQPLGPAGGQYKVTIDASNVKQHHSRKSKRCVI